MRQSELGRLQQPFPKDDQRGPDEQLSDALGVSVPEVRALAEELQRDLDPSVYGIGWWSGYGLGPRRRILIADQMMLCVTSIEMNLREAKIHFLEAGRLFDEKSRELVATLGFDLLDGPSLHARPLGAAVDHLAGELARMHTIGVVRAVASALDCLAGVVIGVGALKKSILRADFNEVQRNVFRKMKPPITDGERLQFELAEAIVRVVDQSGPLGWMEWLLDYRNMLVHRGRHVEKISLLRAEISA